MIPELIGETKPLQQTTRTTTTDEHVKFIGIRFGFELV
jgi:hypothetical protein